MSPKNLSQGSHHANTLDHNPLPEVRARRRNHHLHGLPDGRNCGRVRSAARWLGCRNLCALCGIGIVVACIPLQEAAEPVADFLYPDEAALYYERGDLGWADPTFVGLNEETVGFELTWYLGPRTVSLDQRQWDAIRASSVEADKHWVETAPEDAPEDEKPQRLTEDEPILTVTTTPEGKTSYRLNTAKIVGIITSIVATLGGGAFLLARRKPAPAQTQTTDSP